MDNISIFQPSGQRFNYHSMPPYTHFFALITPSHTWKFYLTSQSTTYWFTIYFPHKTLVGQRLTSRPPIIRPVVRLPLHAFTYPDFSMLLLSAIYGNFIRHPTPLHIDLYFKARTFFRTYYSHNFTKPKTRIFDLQPPIAKVSKKVITLLYSFSSSLTPNQVVSATSKYSVQTLYVPMRYISKLQVGQYPVGWKPTVILHLTGNTSKHLSKCPQAFTSTHMPSHTHLLALHLDLLYAAIHHILALLIEYLTTCRTYSYDNSSPSAYLTSLLFLTLTLSF
jgi:hypothetical protein